MRPTTLDVLDDYVTGGLDDLSADEIDEALFEAALAGDETLGIFDLIYRAGLDLIERGTFSPFILEAVAVRLAEEGRDRVQFTQVESNTHVVTSPTAEVVITRFPLGVLHGLSRIDQEIVVGGVHVKTISDLVFDPEATAVYACCEGDLARAATRPQVQVRFVGRDSSGSRLLAEFHLTAEVGER